MKRSAAGLRALVCVPGLLGVLLSASPALAQRVGDGPPGQDPFQRRVVPARAVPGGRYLSHTFANGSLFINGTNGSRVSVQRWAQGVVRVEYRAAGQEQRRQDVQFDEAGAVWENDSSRAMNYHAAMRSNNSVSVVSQRKSWKTDEVGHIVTRFVDDSNQGVLRLHLGKHRDSIGGYMRDVLPDLEVVVHKNPLRVSILQGTDTLVAEAASAFLRQAAPPTPATRPAPGGTAVRFRLAPGEALYGTGSRALPLNRRGQRLELYNQAHYGSQNGEPNLNIALPVVLSSRGYLLLFDHHAAGYLDLGKTDHNVLEYGGENLSTLSYFVVTGKNQAEILDRYTALTGRQPLPPRWALGLIQSRFGYKSAQEMYDVAARMRREDFPLDALVLDLFWFGGTRQQGDLSWYKPGFPDPVGMMSRLKQDGVNTVLISEPYVMRTSRNDSTVRTLGLVGTGAGGKAYTVESFWAGPATILDVFKPSARQWLWSYYRTLHDQGAAGWWSDLGEPENHPDAMQHAWGPARQVHNAYGQVWAGIFQENYAKAYPDERLFNLARSGWAGLQRNAVFPWSGDINRSWSGLQAQVPVMVGMSQAGVGYMHSDAGGFCVGGVDPELYTRWLQMASLCPILRPHGEGVPPEPYWFPDPYKSAVRQATHLRYELLPYLYTLAWQNTTTGAPLVRPMDYDRSYDPAIGAASLPNDQYLLGPSLLVAPVLHPSQRRRNVALPTGNWIDFYTNQTYAGGRTAGVPAPLARTPLLVKAGAFLPLTNYRPSTARYRPDTLLLRYYPDPQVPESEFTLYDDDGHSARALARHQYETLTMRGFCTPQQTDVILSSNGDYPGQPVYRLLRLLVQRVAAPPTAVLLDGQPTPQEAWTYDAARHELEVHFLMNAGTAVSLRGLKLDATPTGEAAPDALTLEAPDQRSFGPGGTTLRYTRHAAGPAMSLQLRNTQGTVVRTLPLTGEAGPHALPWDARDAAGRPLPPGVYTAEAQGQHQRLILTLPQ